MANQRKIMPTPGYHYRAQPRIVPRENYKIPSLHTRSLPRGSIAKSVDMEWCPICLGRQIKERMVNNNPIWHCAECGNEW